MFDPANTAQIYVRLKVCLGFFAFLVCIYLLGLHVASVLMHRTWPWSPLHLATPQQKQP